MTDRVNTCVFCGNKATKVVVESKIINYRGMRREKHIPFCNLGCVRTILVGAGDCDNAAIEQAIKVAKAHNQIDEEAEAAKEYRRGLLREAAEYVDLI